MYVLRMHVCNVTAEAHAWTCVDIRQPRPVPLFCEQLANAPHARGSLFVPTRALIWPQGGQGSGVRLTSSAPPSFVFPATATAATACRTDIPIVGGGGNSAALHYNDNDQRIPEGGIVLIDAGAELGGTRNGGGWTSDITRTWPCSGKFTPAQKAVYDVVFEAEDACLQLCTPGQSMSTATKASNAKLIEGLLRVGILKGGTVAEILAANILRLFMPHGLGHSVGLDVHDPGSLTPFAAHKRAVKYTECG